MTLKKTQLIGITSVVGLSTVGILTVGVTDTQGGVGIASTCYVRSVVMHNTGLGTARVSLYLNESAVQNAVATGVTANKFLTVDLAANETSFFEVNYPLVMSNWGDTLSVAIDAPDDGGTGIGSMVNFIVNGDTDV
tara:strand:+ start:1632 stop:2039 length:408 start_codon:yes stop_codon:yes gene_type:complete